MPTDAKWPDPLGDPLEGGTTGASSGSAALPGPSSAIGTAPTVAEPYADLLAKLDHRVSVTGFHDGLYAGSAVAIRALIAELAACRASIARQSALIPTIQEAERAVGRTEERERIAKALEDEADLTPCEEDAKVVRGCAALVRADFSYDEAERLANEAADVPEERDRG